MMTTLKEERMRKGVSVNEMSSLLGISRQAYYMYERGDRLPPVEAMTKIADRLGVSVEYLANQNPTGTDMRSSGIFPLPKVVKKPRLGAIACGEPIFCEQQFDGYDFVPEEIHCDFTLVARGDSMIGAHITNGSIVYIHAQPDCENREIAAVLLNGEEVTLKRVLKNSQGEPIMLLPDNPSYNPIDLSSVTEFKILGKAVGFISRL